MSGPNSESDRSPESRVDDRTLEEFLSRQGEVRAAWQAAKPVDDAPSAALDAQILQMAAQATRPALAATAPTRPMRGWSGAKGGWALAASVVLGSALLLRVTESPEYLAQPAGQRPAPEASTVAAASAEAAAAEMSDATAAPAADAVAPESELALPKAAAGQPSAEVTAAAIAAEVRGASSDSKRSAAKREGSSKALSGGAVDVLPGRAERSVEMPAAVAESASASRELAAQEPQAFPSTEAAPPPPAPLPPAPPPEPVVAARPQAPPSATLQAAPPARAAAAPRASQRSAASEEAVAAFAPEPAPQANAKRRAQHLGDADTDAAGAFASDEAKGEGLVMAEAEQAVQRLLAAERAGRVQPQAVSAWVCAAAEFTLTTLSSERALVNLSAECHGQLVFAGPSAGWQPLPIERHEQRRLWRNPSGSWEWAADHVPPLLSPAAALRWWQARGAASGLSQEQSDRVAEQLNSLPK